MVVFIGEHICKLDAKGRMMLPSALKKQLPSALQDKFVVKKDIFEQCLVMFPLEEWDRQVTMMRKKLNPYNKEHNKFLRAFFRGSAELELDGTGRLLIPKRLLEQVGVNKEVVLAGQDGKIEIWSRELYDEQELSDDDFAGLAEKIMGGGIEENE